MTFSKIGRILTALVATAALGLGMTACGGGTIGYLFVAGGYYNQISGFKIDDYTGNLTPIEHGPFATNANGPVTVLVKPGGRFVYVISSGTAPNPALINTPGYTPPTDGGITIFAVGGDGVLTYQTSYPSLGYNPVWATFDSSGNYLYVTDKYSNYYCAVAGTCNNPNPAVVNIPAIMPPKTIMSSSVVDLDASITAFSVAADDGRLTVVTNNEVLALGNNVPTKVFEIPAGAPTAIPGVLTEPVMSKLGSGSCLFTLESQTIYPFVVGGNGQLTVATTGPYQVSGNPLTNLTSINTGGTYTYVTDAGTNQIFSLTSGGSQCSFTPISGSQQANISGTANPVNSITDSSGKFLYVLNQSSSSLPQGSNPSQSTISAFTIQPGTGQLATLADSTNNPYAVGSGPVCIVQDPTNQYLYISDNTDSTITGKLFDQRFGYLSNLSRGSTFVVTMRPTCLAVSGNL